MLGLDFLAAASNDIDIIFSVIATICYATLITQPSDNFHAFHYTIFCTAATIINTSTITTNIDGVSNDDTAVFNIITAASNIVSTSNLSILLMHLMLLVSNTAL